MPKELWTRKKQATEASRWKDIIQQTAPGVLAPLLLTALTFIATKVATLPATFAVGAIGLAVGIALGATHMMMTVRIVIALALVGSLIPLSSFLQRYEGGRAAPTPSPRAPTTGTVTPTSSDPPGTQDPENSTTNGVPNVRRDDPLTLVPNSDHCWDLDRWAEASCSFDGDLNVSSDSAGYYLNPGQALLTPVEAPEPSYATCANVTTYYHDAFPIDLDHPFFCVNTDGERYALIKLTQSPNLRGVQTHVKIWELS